MSSSSSRTRSRSAARYRGLTLRVLGRRGPAIGPGKAELVERIAQTGSISAAARAMGMSYRRAWQLVEALNRDFGEAVVATAIGGRAGGGARVSGFGRRIVARYRAMEAKACRSIAAEVKAFEALLARRKR